MPLRRGCTRQMPGWCLLAFPAAFSAGHFPVTVSMAPCALPCRTQQGFCNAATMRAAVLPLQADKGMRDAQDPSKTWDAYSHGADRDKDSAPSSRGIPSEEELGTEREVKWGQNIPASAGQAKEELKFVSRAAARCVGCWVLGWLRGRGRELESWAGVDEHAVVPGALEECRNEPVRLTWRWRPLSTHAFAAVVRAVPCSCQVESSSPLHTTLARPCRPAKAWPSRRSRRRACCSARPRTQWLAPSACWAWRQTGPR